MAVWGACASARRLIFASATPAIYGVLRYRPTLERIVARRAIETCFRQELVELWPKTREAVFERLETGEWVVVSCDLLHVTPPQSAPDFVKRGPLAGRGGWLELEGCRSSTGRG